MQGSRIIEIKNCRALTGCDLKTAVEIVDGRAYSEVGTYKDPLTGYWKEIVDHYPAGVWWQDGETGNKHHFNGKDHSPVWYDKREYIRRKVHIEEA